MNTYKNKIIIITGGTGGHIIPSITIYKKLKKLNWEIYWIIDKLGSEYLIKEKIYNNINISYTINFKKLNFFQKIFSIIKFIKYIIKTKKIIKKINPNISLGMGSYASFIGCVSSWINNIPLILHEQNSIIGLSNKILSIISKKILKGININNINNNNKIIFTGNPIRNSILKINHLSNKIKNRKGPIRILILGGSQGSEFINNLIINNINKLNNILIWHQVGKNKYKYIYNKYNFLSLINIIYKIDEFIENINKAYLWADILISRSGALIVSEVLFIGLPSIFIPFPHKDNHQYFNALKLKNIGLSKIIKQSELSNIFLIKYLLNINRNILYNMSINSKKINNDKFSINNIINQLYKFLKK